MKNARKGRERRVPQPRTMKLRIYRDPLVALLHSVHFVWVGAELTAASRLAGLMRATARNG